VVSRLFFGPFVEVMPINLDSDLASAARRNNEIDFELTFSRPDTL
jgi:hypothetical protein